MKSKVGHTRLSEPESDLICNWTRIQRSKIEIKLINVCLHIGIVRCTICIMSPQKRRQESSVTIPIFGLSLSLTLFNFNFMNIEVQLFYFRSRSWI
jgi:hypothetical protein